MARARTKYTVILQEENDPEFSGYYNAVVPALPGCFTYGASKAEALANVREAIALYLDDLQAGQGDSRRCTGRVTISCSWKGMRNATGERLRSRCASAILAS